MVYLAAVGVSITPHPAAENSMSNPTPNYLCGTVGGIRRYAMILYIYCYIYRVLRFRNILLICNLTSKSIVCIYTLLYSHYDISRYILNMVSRANR